MYLRVAAALFFSSRGLREVAKFQVLGHHFFVSNYCEPVPILLGLQSALLLQRPWVLDEDHKAIFIAWLKEHSSSVIQVARAYTLTNEECQDLAQEILLQAWQSLPKFEGKSSPATWFYRVALHTAMNWRRKDRTRRIHQQSWLDVQFQAFATADSSGQVEQRELIDQLYQAIHQLPPTDIALVLLYLDEMSYREMANTLGISESNVGVRLNRAKQTLATLLTTGSAEGQSDDSR